MKASRVVATLFAMCFSMSSQATTIYATDVHFTTNDAGAPGINNRRDPGNSLGPVNGSFPPDTGFYSLGLGGKAVFEFGEMFTGPTTIVEVTGGNPLGHPEAVEVYVGNTFSDLIADYDFVGTITNSDAQNPGDTLAFNGVYQYLMLVDITPTLTSPSTDGFDVDAVGVTAVPLPAAAWLFISALTGLGLVSRRRSPSVRDA